MLAQENECIHYEKQMPFNRRMPASILFKLGHGTHCVVISSSRWIVILELVTIVFNGVNYSSVIAAKSTSLKVTDSSSIPDTRAVNHTLHSSPAKRKRSNIMKVLSYR